MEFLFSFLFAADFGHAAAADAAFFLCISHTHFCPLL